MGEFSPQRHANPNNPIIVVGSVDWDGRASDFNSHVGPAFRADSWLTGEMSVYALGRDIPIVVPGPEDHYRKESGTSLAAPQIAGLAAYFLGLPGLPWTKGIVSKTMKDWLVSGSRQPPWSPDGFNVGYNKVHDILQYCVPGSSVLPPGASRGWGLDLTGIPGRLIRIFKRQSKGVENVIFEKGQLRNSKYSNEVTILPARSFYQRSFKVTDGWSFTSSSLVSCQGDFSHNLRGHPNQLHHPDQRHRPSQQPLLYPNLLLQCPLHTDQIPTSQLAAGPAHQIQQRRAWGIQASMKWIWLRLSIILVWHTGPSTSSIRWLLRMIQTSSYICQQQRRSRHLSALLRRIA